MEPFSPWNPGWTVTFGAVKVTVAPFSTVTSLPNVMAVALEQEQVVPVRYMALVITPSPGQSGHSELDVWVRVKVLPAMVINPVLSVEGDSAVYE